MRRSAARPTVDLTAYDLYLRAYPHWSSFEKDRILHALDLLGQAVELDPHYGPALALAAQCHHVLAVNDWTDDPEVNRRKGVDMARRALRLAPDDPEVLANAAAVLGLLGEDIEVAIGSIDRSLALNPSFARGWLWSSILRNVAGQPDLAIEHYKRSVRLSPRDRMGMFSVTLGAAYFYKRQFDDAATILLASLQEAPSFAVIYRFLAACYAHMGQLAEAREIIARLKAITPVVIPSVIPLRNPEQRELFLSGLRLAAGDET